MSMARSSSPNRWFWARKGEAAGQTHTELALLLAQGGLVVDAVEAAQVLDEGAQVVGHAVRDLTPA